MTPDNPELEAEVPAEAEADAAVDALNAPAPEPAPTELPPADPTPPPLAPPAPAAEEKLLEVEPASENSGEARDERKKAAQKAYAANPPEESRAARKARSPQE